MKRMTKYIVVLGLLSLFMVGASTLSLAADDKKSEPLISELKYDEKKQMMYGKTVPHANVYLNNVAGNVVASDTGEFEFPIPKGTKVSIVSSLDAEGDNSTNVRFNFEKNTIEEDDDSGDSTKETQSSNAPSTSSSTQKDEGKEEAESKQQADTDETKEATSTSEKTSDSNKESIDTDIIEESYESTPDPKRSKVWLWTLLIILVVIGTATAFYFWYKKKIEKEEAEKEKQKKKKRNKSKKRKEPSSTITDEKPDLDVDADPLDKMIESEMNQLKPSKSKRSGASSSKSKKKKKKIIVKKQR